MNLVIVVISVKNSSLSSSSETLVEQEIIVTARFPLNKAIIILELMVSSEFKDLYAFRHSSIPTRLIAVLLRDF